jgi:hypothetical protein
MRCTPGCRLARPRQPDWPKAGESVGSAVAEPAWRAWAYFLRRRLLAQQASQRLGRAGDGRREWLDRSRSPAHARIKRVSQAITQEIEGEHRDC